MYKCFRSSYYPSYSSWMAYGTTFFGTIIENLQIEVEATVFSQFSALKYDDLLQIRDVHIRYEDDVSLGPDRRAFACGFSVESLSARTSDHTFVPKFVHREPGGGLGGGANNSAFKLVELESMSAYLDMDAELFGGLGAKELEVGQVF